MLLKVNNVYLQYPSPGGEGLYKKERKAVNLPSWMQSDILRKI